jgi:drug/metabolite transporter (DMT)-like permease
MTHQFRGILALLLVTLVWGTTFPAMKDLTVYFAPVWIIFIRFAVAAVLLAPFLYKAGRDDLVSGGLLGVLLFFCFQFQVEGLALTSSNRNAFICGLSVLFVPLFGALITRKVPEKRILLALVLAVSGLAALCWDGGPWGRGDTFALGSAAAFAVYIKMMEFRTRRASRLMTLTAAQILTVAVCAAIWLLARDVPRTTIDAAQDLANYWSYIGHGLRQYAVNLLYLGVVATAAIISLQSWGQARASANEAAVIYSFEPAAAAFFAFFLLAESMTARGWLGGALLIAGMIVSQWNAAPRPAAALAPE